MAIQTSMKRLQLSTAIISAAVLLGACGEPHPGEEEIATENGVTAFDIIPPAVTMTCSNDYSSSYYCSGSATHGVAPYTYQWQEVDDFGGGSTSNYWYTGATNRYGNCPWGLYTYGRYYSKYIRFRVLDANNYVSNVVEQRFTCWTPND